MSATVAINAEMVVGANVIVDQALSIVAGSEINIQSDRVMPFAFDVVGTSTMTCFARLKWEVESDTSEDWSEVADSDTTWTPIADTTENWQIAA